MTPMTRLLRSACCILTLGIALSPTHAGDDEFTVVALPDTQFYSQDYPETYIAQTQWVVDNLAARDIRFVTHLGDLVNEAATLWQWDNAVAAMSNLDNGAVPYGTCVGNHDVLYPGDYYDPAGTNYLAYFGPQLYQNRPWFGGASPSGLSNYQIVSAGGQDFLFLHLLLETPAQELAWAQQVLNENRDKPTWISTHRYLFDWRILGQGRYDDWNYTFEPLYRHDGIKADDFYNNFVKVNRQVYLVHCGHNDGEYRQTSPNNYGLTVHEVLADFQNTYGNGGNGWLRVMRFAPDADRISVETYSPTLNDFRTGSASRFDLAVDFDQYTSDRPTLRFQQGFLGYSGTRDTWINEDAKNTSYGNSGTVVVDDDTANSIFGDYQGQGIFEFEGLFGAAVHEGDPEPDFVPVGSVIHRAILTINLADDTDIGNPEYYVYRMTRDWSESSTWNSLDDGIQVGVDTDSTRIATFFGDNDPDLDFSRTLDVTAGVAPWSAGAANHGLAILPERVDFNDDGIEIRSSENGETALRPALDVEFTYDVINVSPAVDPSLAASELSVDEGTEVTLTVGASDPNPLDPLVFALNGVDVGFATGSGVIEHAVLIEDEGTFDFMAAVSDDESTVAAGEVSVTAVNVAPRIMAMTGDRTVDIDRVFRVEVVAVDPGILDVISYAWELSGDAGYDDLFEAEGLWSYSTLGDRAALLRVSDDDGGETDASATITVADLPADGDFDSDGILDACDRQRFEACIAGPGVPPTPPAPFTVGNCLAAFDFDSDGDVDGDDRAHFERRFERDDLGRSGRTSELDPFRGRDCD